MACAVDTTSPARSAIDQGLRNLSTAWLKHSLGMRRSRVVDRWKIEFMADNVLGGANLIRMGGPFWTSAWALQNGRPRRRKRRSERDDSGPSSHGRWHRARNCSFPSIPT